MWRKEILSFKHAEKKNNKEFQNQSNLIDKNFN